MENSDPNQENRLEQYRREWDAFADQFDREPDHGLHDPQVRSAWVDLLRSNLPPSPASVLDVGCGTGSLSVVLSTLGYLVTSPLA